MAENNVVNAAVLQLTATDLDLDANGGFDYVICDVIAYCAAPARCSDDDVTGDDVTSDDVTSASSRVFRVDSRSGLLRVGVSLDRERHSHFRISVFAVDRGLPAQTGSSVVEVVVDDVNDHRPEFLPPQNGTGNSNGGLELGVLEDAADGQVVGQLRAVDGDATFTNNRIYYYFRSSAKFAVDADTGELRLRGRLDRERQAR